VVPLFDPPTPSVYLSCTPYGTLPEPVNMTCSNRCAKPVRPTTSFLEPTLYQTFTATVGVVLSGDRMTVRPLGSVKVSKGRRRVSDDAAARVACGCADKTAVCPPVTAAVNAAAAIVA
jgi:hypothetical protein